MAELQRRVLSPKTWETVQGINQAESVTVATDEGCSLLKELEPEVLIDNRVQGDAQKVGGFWSMNDRDLSQG